MSPIIVKNTANIHNIFYIAKKIRNLDTKQPHHSKKIYRNFRFRFNLPTFEKMKMGLWKKAKCQKDIQNFINFSEN